MAPPSGTHQGHDNHANSYHFPSSDLLDALTEADALQITADDLIEVQETIVNRLASLGVDVIPGDITCGCNVTRYEFFPAAGVSMEKIRRHKSDIAMVLRTDQFIFLIPVPGKDSMGIEIPNKQSQKVTLRELIESDEWRQTDAKIPLLLGRNIESQPIIADLDQLPHLLIAGNIGSGKSVCLHAIIACLLYRFTPWQLRMVLIDPDVLDLQVYNTLPHLTFPVITDSKRALLALQLVLKEIERRHNLLAQIKAGAIADTEPFPMMVVILTELSPLLFDNADAFEQTISLIIKTGHIVAVHLIAATRVLHPGVIRPIFKLNIPSRIAFQVLKEKDSLLLLDEYGAERLQGQGDMLYRAPNSTALYRIQGAYISDDEIHRLVAFVSSQAPPDFVAPAQDSESEEVSEEEEEIVQQCIGIMKEERKASTSLFQRRLRLGYTRAAHIINILEQRGYVGPGDGTAPRKILVDLDNLI
ncbi:MAG: DNA translocase FtsK [Chthoniobacteraceae bacterium]